MPPRKLALANAGLAISKAWTPVIAGQVNDCQIKLARFAGDFAWHRHATEDEAFLVLEGRIALAFRDGTVEHRPRAISEDALVLMFEPATTLNTGTVTTDRTVAELERL